MLELKRRHKSLLEQYNRPIVHMRSQVGLGRFGLVFGAGISKNFGIPTWSELIDQLARERKVQGVRLLKVVPPRAGLPYRTEMLFEHFKQRRYSKVSDDSHHTRLFDYRIAAEWREIVRKHLYAKVKTDLGKSLKSHPYMKQFVPLIQRSYMTVTYNFDDFIEQALYRQRSSREASESRGFESVTNPWTQFRRTQGIIYHPNGVVPQNPLETPSDRFVFSEASYADQLMGIFAGDHAGLLNHFSKHTCLFVGLSLEDETLRTTLMQAARSCPGNFHYFVCYLKPGEILDEKKRHAISLANFKVYNLVTLFLDDKEIRAVAELINVEKCPETEFADFASEHNIRVKFKFYITGPIGVGKTTAINHFRNLEVIDEWLEPRPEILSKDWEELTDDEKRTADDWLAGQFKKKNSVLRNKKEGIFMLDRGPLDPLSFTADGEWSEKATLLLKTICPKQMNWKIEDGRVILLQGDSEELALRMIITQRKGYTAKKLHRLETQLSKAYGSNGVTCFDTRGLTPADTTLRIAEIVHLEDYEQKTSNLHERLVRIEREGFDVEN